MFCISLGVFEFDAVRAYWLQPDVCECSLYGARLPSVFERVLWMIAHGRRECDQLVVCKVVAGIVRRLVTVQGRMDDIHDHDT